MRRLLLAVAVVFAAAVPAAAADTWNVAMKRGDYAEAAMLLHRVVFEPAPAPRGQDAAALRQLAQLYAEGKGVEQDEVLACGLVRAHAIAAGAPRGNAAAMRAAQSLVERYCGRLTPADRAAAFAAM